MEEIIQISVKTLVEFVMRSGSIDNRFGGLDRALEGGRIHRRLQKAGGAHYRAEVYLHRIDTYKGMTFAVDGRADGIISEGEGITIDEIKTTAAPTHLITEEFNPLHWAQAMGYGYIYCKNEGLAQVQLRLTYVQVDTEEILRFYRTFSIEALEEFYFDLLERYKVWADMRAAWAETRTNSIRTLHFPFPNYRPGQRELAVGVYRTIIGGGKLYCQAPTGIGKTISTLFPAVKALGEGVAERIFYFTAKTITRQAAEEALEHMRTGEARPLRLRSVTLTAKDKICFLEERECNPEACPYADGYFHRVNQIVLEMLEKHDVFSRTLIEEYARENSLCPFELSLDLALWCDCIICDYNYLFDPEAYLRRFFCDEKSEPFVFLIDEAHNLVDRAREMFSAGLEKREFLSLKRQLNERKKHGPEKKLYIAANQINEWLLQLRKTCGETKGLLHPEPLEEFNKLLARFLTACEEWRQERRNDSSEFVRTFQRALLEIYFQVRSYVRIADFYDERYTTYAEVHGSEVSVRQLCLDPSKLLNTAMKRGKAAVLFSATLMPLDYFTSVLGGDETAKRFALPSPFPQKNMRLIVADFIGTKYQEREASLSPIAELIARTAASRRGNYIVYFPSYQYMQSVYAVFTERYPDVQTVLQHSGMTEPEREEFLLQFDQNNAATLLGFCVLGGIYSEGIDLKGERLICTIIVGVGLPQINSELNILRDYYDEINGSGFSYAYQYPGMNKILQAAGRVIRSEHDRGVVVLVDRRFAGTSYQRLFPGHWQDCHVIHNLTQLERELTLFWNQAEKRHEIEETKTNVSWI